MDPNNIVFNPIGCFAVTKKGLQCKHNKFNINDIYCTMHNNYKPKEIFFGNIKIKAIRLDEYKYLIEETKNKFIDSDKIINLLKDYNNKLNLEIKLENIKKQTELEIKITNIKTCKCCCLDDFLDEQLLRCNKITLDNAHKVCIECIISYFETQLNDTNVSLKCMFDNSDKCDGYYNIDILRGLMSEEQFNRYYDLYLINEVKELAKTIDNYQICPHCAKFGIEVNVENNEKVSIKCGRCDKDWCNLCRKPIHNEHCYKFIFSQNLSNGDKLNIIDNTITEIISKKLIHICPHCNSSFIKIDGEGCNLMTCTNCKGYSCYVCGIKIIEKNKSHYYHFTGHALNDGQSNCPLWNNTEIETTKNGNRRYNETQIINELDLLLNVNSNNDIRKVIFDRIKKIYMRDYKQIPENIINLGKKYKLIEQTCVIL
jgi:hypothetical protein